MPHPLLRATLTLLAACTLLTAMALSPDTTATKRHITPVVAVDTTSHTPTPQHTGNQRHITPVQPETNTVLTPPKGTSEEVIQRYISGDSTKAIQQARKDSLRRVYKRYPRLTDLTVGINFIEPLLMAFGQSYASTGVHATLNMWNRFQPVVELGVGFAKSTPDDMNFTYKGKFSPYFKVGANYNFMFKNTPDYQVGLGIRLGYSTFGYDVTDVHYTNSYWQEDLTYNLTGERSHALWGELVAGLRVKLWNHVSMGWAICYHTIFNYGKNDTSRPWFIPGYGPRSNPLGLSVSVCYTLPLYHEETPPATDNTITSTSSNSTP